MPASDWQKIARESDIKESRPVAFDLGKDRVLVTRVKDSIYACAGKCTHYGGPLEKGVLVGSTITCPWHTARFDVATGVVLAPPALDHLRCYETKVENGDVFVRPAPKVKSSTRTGTEGKTFVILGGGAAGNAAAETLRWEGFAGRIVIVTPEADLPYDRPNLSKDYLAGKAKPEWVPLRSAKFYADRGIEFLTGRTATTLDPKTRAVTLDNGEVLSFDRLLLATGGRPRALSIPGAELENVFTLRSLADCNAIISSLPSARSVVIVGGGFIGMEVASSLVQRKLEVHMVSSNALPMSHIFGQEVAHWLKSLHESQGVRFHMNRIPVAIKGTGRARSVTLDDGSTLPADLVIVGVGITPAVDYLAGAGLVENGEVPVDQSLATRSEGIFAAGDIAAVPYSPLSRRIRVEHWTVAERQGCHAARAMLGARAPYNEVPYFWTHQYDKSLSYAGFAQRFDRVVLRGKVSDDGFLAGYYLADKLLAVASLWRDTEFIALVEIMKAGRLVPSAVFQDSGADLRELQPVRI